MLGQNISKDFSYNYLHLFAPYIFCHFALFLHYLHNCMHLRIQETAYYSRLAYLLIYISTCLLRNAQNLDAWLAGVHQQTFQQFTITCNTYRLPRLKLPHPNHIHSWLNSQTQQITGGFAETTFTEHKCHASKTGSSSETMQNVQILVIMER